MLLNLSFIIVVSHELFCLVQGNKVSKRKKVCVLDNSGLGIFSFALHSLALVTLLKRATIEQIALIALYLSATGAKM